jgi:nitroimidazol reductase NimA-like FMN-containing flavoprotein (pyridoxamine 5'-phosphate oxidase superfamily)
MRGIMPNFTTAEKRFLQKNELARLATSAVDLMPHVVPVCYVFSDDTFLIAIDYATKKYQNLIRNSQVALVVDSLRPNRGVMVQGRAKIIEAGSEFQGFYAIFRKKFSWVRAEPWKEGEAPFIRIVPAKKASWGFR